MALGVEAGAVEGDDAGRLLAAMLERMQAEHGQRRGVGVAEDAENAALLAQLVVVERPRRQLVHLALFPRRQFPPFSISRFSSCRGSSSLGPGPAASGGDSSGACTRVAAGAAAIAEDLLERRLEILRQRIHELVAQRLQYGFALGVCHPGRRRLGQPQEEGLRHDHQQQPAPAAVEEAETAVDGADAAVEDEVRDLHG